MFKKTLLAMTVIASFGANAAVTSSATVNGTGITNSDGEVVHTGITVSSEGSQGNKATFLSLVTDGTNVAATNAAGPSAAAAGNAEIAFDIGSSKLAQYASLYKIRVTLTGATINPASDLKADFDAANAAGDDLDIAADNAAVEFPAANVVELTYAGDNSVIAEADKFYLSGLALDVDSINPGTQVVAKIEMISNVGDQVIDSASAVLVEYISQLYAGTYTAGRFNNTIDVTEDRMLFTDGSAEDTITLLALTTAGGSADWNAVDVSASTPKFVINGDFSFLDQDGDGKLDAGMSLTGNGNVDSITYAADKLTVETNGYALLTSVTVETNEEVELPTQSFFVDSSFTYEDYNGTARSWALSGLYGGAWDLNGTNVNVPYLPVGYDNLSANIEIANESTLDGEISITGFDQNGNKYDTVKLSKIAAGKTVTKVSEADIVAAFGLTTGTKLSLTVTVNAPSGVTVYPYYRENDVRTSLPTSQYRPYLCEASGTISTTTYDGANAVVDNTTDRDYTAADGVYSLTSGSVSTSCKKAND